MRNQGLVRINLIATTSLACAIAAPAAATAVTFAQGSWAAVDRGAVCEALGRAERIAVHGKPQAVAGFSFSVDRRHRGEFHARLSRPARAGSTVILTIGERPFLLQAQGEWAWSGAATLDRALLDAVRLAPSMRLEAHDSAGRRFVDRYLLDGAPTAVDSAAARCAGKMPRP